MKQNPFFDEGRNRSGLVIVFPPGVTSLFNPSVHRLVHEVEELLDGVFVTHALSGGGDPDIEAALNASRFAGCSSAVVVYSADWFLAEEWADMSSDTMLSQNVGSAILDNTARRLAEAFSAVQSTTGVAA